VRNKYGKIFSPFDKLHLSFQVCLYSISVKVILIVAVVFVFLQKKENIRSLTMCGHVGFESLPDQLVDRSIQQGFCFNILCVGEFANSSSNFLMFLVLTSSFV
jgi:hypothetical protein